MPKTFNDLNNWWLKLAGGSVTKGKLIEEYEL
jgi:hypothetical protein